MEQDTVNIGTIFMKQFVGRILKSILKRNGIDVESLSLKEFNIAHEKDGLVRLNVNLGATIEEHQLIDVLRHYDL